MKIITILFLGLTFLFILSVDAFSDVVVYTNEDIQSSSGTQSEADATPSEAETGEVADLSTLSGGGVRYILEGSLIIDTKISAPVILKEDCSIVDIKIEGGKDIGFSIVRIEKGKEAQVLASQSANELIGKKLLAGTYKVYPDGNIAGGASILEKVKVIVYIGVYGTTYLNEENMR